MNENEWNDTVNQESRGVHASPQQCSIGESGVTITCAHPLSLSLSLSLFILRHKVSWCTEGIQSDRDRSIVAFVVLRIQTQIHVCNYKDEKRGPQASLEPNTTPRMI